MTTIRYVQLNNGTAIPIIGHGAWAPKEGIPEAKNWLVTALKAGFRHIDTAQGYGTEKVVSEAIKESGIPKEDVFVTTKLPWNHHGRVKESLDESLKNLGTECVDLYLMHWPQCLEYDPENPLPKNPDGTIKTTDTVTFLDSWAEMETALAEGKCRAIGVSNFSIKNLEKLLKTAKVVPACNQVELHPYLAQNELRKYCQEKGIAMVAYTPTGGSDVIRKDPVIVEIAAKYKVSSNQVILAWHLARDTIIVPKSVNETRQKENLNLPTLEEEDVKRINALDRNERICNKPDDKGQVWGWTVEQLGW